MSKRIYVGNLPFSATEDEVRELFEPFGAVESVHLVTDRDTGRPRGCTSERSRTCCVRLANSGSTRLSKRSSRSRTRGRRFGFVEMEAGGDEAICTSETARLRLR